MGISSEGGEAKMEGGGEAVEGVGGEGFFGGEELVEGEGGDAGVFGELVERCAGGVDGAAEFTGDGVFVGGGDGALVAGDEVGEFGGDEALLFLNPGLLAGGQLHRDAAGRWGIHGSPWD